MLTQERKAELAIQWGELNASKVEVADTLDRDHVKNALFYFTTPNPPQELLLRAWRDPYKKVFTFTGGNRSGKTTIGVIIALSVVFGEWLWSGEKITFPHNRPRKVRIIGQDWEKHIQAVVLEAIHAWWPEKRALSIKKNGQGVEAIWTDKETGSTLEIMSNNQESDVHEGWKGDLIYYDEPPKRDIRVANARGLIDRSGREVFCMTLLKEAWVDREVIRATNKDGSPDTSIFNVHARIYDNVGFGITQEGVEQFAKTLTEDEKEARLEGIPSYMSGLVYPEYKRDLHLIKPFRGGMPLHYMVDIAIDVHPRENQAILFMATAPDNRKYLFHEIWDHGDGTWVGEQVVKYVQAHSLRVANIIIDPLAKGDRNNDNTVYDKVELILGNFGLPLDTASKDKASGINLVKSHLISPNNEPVLFVFNNLVRTPREFDGYMWDKDTNKPVDKDDHMMENLYRLLLLDTQYEPMEDSWGEDDIAPNTANAWTGY